MSKNIFSSSGLKVLHIVGGDVRTSHIKFGANLKFLSPDLGAQIRNKQLCTDTVRLFFFTLTPFTFLLHFSKITVRIKKNVKFLKKCYKFRFTFLRIVSRFDTKSGNNVKKGKPAPESLE